MDEFKLSEICKKCGNREYHIIKTQESQKIAIECSKCGNTIKISLPTILNITNKDLNNKSSIDYLKKYINAYKKEKKMGVKLQKENKLIFERLIKGLGFGCELMWSSKNSLTYQVCLSTS